MRDGVFRKHGKAIGVDHLRYSVIDLGVYMIRSSGKDYAASSCFLKICQYFFTFFPNIGSCLIKFFPACLGGIIYFVGGYVRECGDKTG